MKRFPRLLAVLCAVIVAAGIPARPALAVSCADLNGAALYSDEPSPVYLGFFGSATAQNSVMNRNGPYGSATGANSVRNTHGNDDPPPWGKYGNKVSHFSAGSGYAPHPPLIVRGGHIFGRLTVNIYIRGLSLSYIDSTCTFSAVEKNTGLPLPLNVPWISASDGTFTDRVEVRWRAAAGASSYALTMTEAGERVSVIFPQTAALGLDVINLKPGVIYHFGVMALNSVGPSNYIYDDGSVAAQVGGTPVPTPIHTPAATPVGASPELPTPTPEGPGGDTPAPTATPNGDVFLPITSK